MRGVTILNANIVLGACLSSGAAFASALLLPSQETTNFYNAKIYGTLGFFPHSKLLLRTY